MGPEQFCKHTLYGLHRVYKFELVANTLNIERLHIKTRTSKELETSKPAWFLCDSSSLSYPGVSCALGLPVQNSCNSMLSPTLDTSFCYLPLTP